MTKNTRLTDKNEHFNLMNANKPSLLEGLREYISNNALSILFGLKAFSEESYGFFNYTAPALA